jgi:hypothetical protein
MRKQIFTCGLGIRTRKLTVQGWVLLDSRVLEHAAREERAAICLICESPWPPFEAHALEITYV